MQEISTFTGRINAIHLFNHNHFHKLMHLHVVGAQGVHSLYIGYRVYTAAGSDQKNFNSRFLRCIFSFHKVAMRMDPEEQWFFFLNFKKKWFF